MDRRPQTARLYLEGGTVLHAAEPSFDKLYNSWILARSSSGSPGLGVRFTNTDGRKVGVAADSIVSVVASDAEHDVSTEFAGKQYLIRGIAGTGLAHDIGIVRDLVPTDSPSCVLVTAEDLASAEVAIIDLSKPFEDAALWLNPAQPDEASELIVRAVFLLARAEQLTTEFNESDVQASTAVSVEADPTGWVPDDAAEDDPAAHRDAIAMVNSGLSGSVRAAIDIAGASFVTSYIGERAIEADYAHVVMSRPDLAGEEGEIVRFDPQGHPRELEVESAEWLTQWIKVEDIDYVRKPDIENVG